MLAHEELDSIRGKIQRGEMPQDEPLFVIRARDITSEAAVLAWAAMAAAVFWSSILLGIPIEEHTTTVTTAGVYSLFSGLVLVVLFGGRPKDDQI